MYDLEEVWLMDEADLDYFPITIGVNYHFIPEGVVDIYAGVFLGYANLGSVLLRRGMFAEAADAYEEATQIAPGMPAAWRGLGHALWKDGWVDGARRALQRALALAPDDQATRLLLRQVGAGRR